MRDGDCPSLIAWFWLSKHKIEWKKIKKWSREKEEFISMVGLIYQTHSQNNQWNPIIVKCFDRLTLLDHELAIKLMRWLCLVETKPNWVTSGRPKPWIILIHELAYKLINGGQTLVSDSSFPVAKVLFLLEWTWGIYWWSQFKLRETIYGVGYWTSSNSSKAWSYWWWRAWGRKRKVRVCLSSSKKYLDSL